jgi:hypothetical protein
MFSSPEKRIKKESATAKSKKDSSEQSGFDKDKSVASKKLNALQEKSEAHSSDSRLSNLQKKANQNDTGLPDPLKQGMESLSGISLDDVKVNYNSNKPSDLGAHAYAEGNQIHVGGGQEKHLAHEAWHVVQQKQGRVNSTREINGTSINDDSALESEATKMGAKALSSSGVVNQNSLVSSFSANTNVAQLAEDGQQEEEKKGFFGKAWDATKSGANTAWDATKSGASSAKKWAKNNKGDAAAKGAKAITSATSFGLKKAGDVAGAGISSGVGGLIGGTYGMAKGGYDFNESRKNKNDLQGKLENAKSNKEKSDLKTQIKLEKDNMGRAGAGTLASTLGAVGAGFTASGVGAPVGAALGAASMGVSAATEAIGAGAQNLRDREARRLRSDKEIYTDRKNKNKARIASEEGSSFNPMNWKSKIDKSLGRNQSGKHAVGTKLDTDGSAAKNYKAAKNSKYEDEGWERTKNKKGTVKTAKKGAAKSWGSALDPRNWGQKDMDKVDVQVSKNLSSKNVDKFDDKLDEEKKEKKSWYNPF